MIRGFAKYKNELQRVVASQNQHINTNVKQNTNEETSKNKNNILMSCLDLGDSSEVKKV